MAISDKVSQDDFFEPTEFICTYSAELVLKQNPSIGPTVTISYLWRKLLFVVFTTMIRTGLFRLEAEIICVRLILTLSLYPSISISPSLFTRQREMKGKRMSKEYSLSLWIKSNESQNIINTVSWFLIITFAIKKE